MIGPTFMKLGRAPAMQAIFIVWPNPDFGNSSLGVHPIVVIAEGAAFDPLPPGAMFHVPGYRIAETRLEGNARAKPHAFLDLGRAHRVAAIVTGAIGYELDQILGLSERAQDALRDLEDVVFVARGN